MPSMAAAMARPSASAGLIEPTATATTAPIMLNIWTVIFQPPSLGDRADTAADVNSRENTEDIRLHEPDQDSECHERNWHQQAGETQNDCEHQFFAHDVAEQAHRQRKGARDFGQDIEGQHYRVWPEVALQIRNEALKANSIEMHG